MKYSTYLFLKFCSINFLHDRTMLFLYTSEPYSQQPWRACLFAIPHEILHTRLLLWNNLVNFSWFVPRRDYIVLIQSRKKWHLRHRRAQLSILFNLITISFSLLILIGYYGILDSNLEKILYTLEECDCCFIVQIRFPNQLIVTRRIMIGG